MNKEHNNILGISLMLIDTFAIAALYAVTKFVTQDIKSSYAVFFYKFSLLVLTLPYVLHNGGFNNIKTPAFKVHLLRGFFSVGGSLSFMYGLQYIKLLDATVLQNVEQMILVVVGIVFFHEKSTKTKIAAIIVSILGVLVVVRPEIITGNFDLFSSGINHGYLFIFLAALFWVGNNIVIKKLGKQSTNKAQLFYLMLFSSIFAYPVAFLEWKMVNVEGFNLLLPVKSVSFADIGLQLSHFKLILVMAFCYLIHSVSLFNSLKYGEFSVVMPFVYFKLLWAGILGYIIFANIPELGSLVGYILIASAGVMLMRREIRNRKRQKQLAQADEAI